MTDPDPEVVARMHTEWWRNWGPNGELKDTAPYPCFCSLGHDHNAEERPLLD